MKRVHLALLGTVSIQFEFLYIIRHDEMTQKDTKVHCPHFDFLLSNVCLELRIFWLLALSVTVRRHLIRLGQCLD